MMALPGAMPMGAPAAVSMDSLRGTPRTSAAHSRRGSFDPPRISDADSTRALFHFPRGVDTNRGPEPAHRTVRVPYNHLRDILHDEIEDWVAGRSHGGSSNKEMEGRVPRDHFLDHDSISSDVKSGTKSMWKALVDSKNKWLGRAKKWRHGYRGEYDGVSILRILNHARKHWWESWRTNPYNLSPWIYSILLSSLMAWSIGSIVCGYYEALDNEARIATFWRGVLGAVPGAVQSAVFLFPPLYVPS